MGRSKVYLSGSSSSTREIKKFIEEIKSSSSTKLVLKGSAPIHSLLEYIDELPKIESVDFSGTTIYSLNNIHKLPNLRELMINNTEIEDLSPISRLNNLRRLDAKSCFLIDISTLPNLQSLEKINLKGANVRRLETLSKLKKVARLDLSFDEIEDFYLISDMTTLADAAIKDARNGLHWTSITSHDQYIRSLSQAKNPDRTVLAINYFREQQGLPPHWPDEYQPYSGDIRGTSADPYEFIKKFDINLLPKQNPNTYTFQRTAEGVVEAFERVGASRGSTQNILHGIIRKKCLELIDECPQGNNQLTLLRNDVEGLLHSLGKELDQLQSVTFWTSANGLRRRRDAEIRTRNSADPLDAPLPEVIGGRLDDLIETVNVFMGGDNYLSQLDARSLGPKDRTDVIQQAKAASGISSAISNTDAASRKTKDILYASMKMIEDGETIGTINGDQAIISARETHKNIVIEIIRSALLDIKSKLSSIGTGAMEEIGASISRNIFASIITTYSEYIIPLFSSFSKAGVIQSVVQAISKILSKS